MSRRELDAAGIKDPALRASYDACRRLNAAHGRTYYLATRLLPPASRPHVHALYGFARYADEIVDDLGSTLTDREKAEWLVGWSERFLAEVQAGHSDHMVNRAVVHTWRTFDLPVPHAEAFLTSMRMDLTVTGYATYGDLMAYVHGSAVVIGLEMVPVLGAAPGVTPEEAMPYAADLGVAFQLSNFVRDVGEDLRRGRVYLPQEDLEAFGVTRDHLAAGVVDGRVRRLLAFEIARTRELYRAAAPGVRLLAPESRDCIRVATALYGGILDAVEAADYRVLDRRVAVGPARRAAVAVPGLWRAVRARRAVHATGRSGVSDLSGPETPEPTDGPRPPGEPRHGHRRA